MQDISIYIRHTLAILKHAYVNAYTDVTAHKVEHDIHTDYQTFPIFRHKTSKLRKKLQVKISFLFLVTLLIQQSKKKKKKNHFQKTSNSRKLTLYTAPVPNFHFLHSLKTLLFVPWKKKIK